MTTEDKKKEIRMKVLQHGFGLKSDLLRPEFQKVKEELEVLNKGHLAWSRQWEYPWAILNSELNETQTILDAGSGHSCLWRYISKKVKKVFLADIDPAVTVHEKDYPNVSTVITDLRKMDAFASNSFDAVYCISVLEHVGDDPMLPFNECMRVLKPSGKFFLTVDVSIEPSPYDFSLAKFSKFCASLGVTPDFNVEILRSREFDIDLHNPALAVYSFITEKQPWE
jgi:ubiquinone/menaquinone biosynthesis C-methylase UbiE